MLLFWLGRTTGGTVSMRNKEIALHSRLQSYVEQLWFCVRRIQQAGEFTVRIVPPLVFNETEKTAFLFLMTAVEQVVCWTGLKGLRRHFPLRSNSQQCFQVLHGKKSESGGGCAALQWDFFTTANMVRVNGPVRVCALWLKKNQRRARVWTVCVQNYLESMRLHWSQL